MGTGRQAWTIARKDLLRRFRDRSAILIGLVLPFGLAGIFSLTLGGADEAGYTATYAVADLDSGEVAHGFSEMLGTLDFVTVRQVRTAGEAERMTDEGEADAAFIFPEGFSDAVKAGSGGSFQVVVAPGSTVGSLVSVSLARSYASRLDAVAIAVGAATAQGAGDAELAQVAQAARTAPPAATVVEGTAGSRAISMSTFFAIGMAVFFLFFTVEFGIRGLMEERDEGTLARLLVAPMNPSAIVAGKAAASFLVGLVSITLLILASSWLLDARWGQAAGLTALVLAGVLAAVGATALVATLARTPAQAGSYASVVAVVGGLLGGTFFPISQAPGLMASLRFLSPQGWLMEGFQELASGGSAASAMPAAAGAATIGAICATVAWIRAGKLVAR